jgi:hypothetical protein
MKHALIDIGTGYNDELTGKFLAITDAPDAVLNDATDFVYGLKKGDCAMDEFVKYITDNGYGMVLVCPIGKLPLFKAINENF